MQKLLKIIFVSLSVLNFIFSAIATIAGITTNGNPTEALAVAFIVSAIISTGVLLCIGFVFISSKVMRIAFIVNSLSAIALIAASIIVFA